MELKVEKHLMSLSLKIPDDLRSGLIIEFHADFDEKLFVLEMCQEGFDFAKIGKIQGDDGFIHDDAPP